MAFGRLGALGRGYGRMGGGGIVSNDPSTILAPSLDLVAGSDTGSSSTDDITGDNTPDILITFNTPLVEGDVVTLQHDDNSGFSSPTETQETADAADVLAGTITFTTGTLASPTSYLRVKQDRSGDVSAWSGTLTLTVDVTAPTVTSATTASVDENATLSHSLTANETVTWSITGGADSAQFEISGSTLRWASNGTQDYEAPADADTNNTYVVQVTATDVAGNATNQTITVTVNNVSEGASDRQFMAGVIFLNQTSVGSRQWQTGSIYNVES